MSDRFLYAALVLAGASAIVLFVAVTGFDADTASVLFSMGAAIPTPKGNPTGLTGATPTGRLVEPGDPARRRFLVAGGRAYTEVQAWAMVEHTPLRRTQVRVWQRQPVEAITEARYASMDVDDSLAFLAHLIWTYRQGYTVSRWQDREIVALTTGARSNSYMAGWVANRVEAIEAEVNDDYAVALVTT